MLSRALIFAAVTLLVGCLAAPAAWAQVQNLEAGKSPSQLFAGTCTACHKSPRGLLKTVSAGALPGFLREHYTTSSDMASQLASFLISNGASDNRQAKQGAGVDAKPAAATDQSDRQGRRPRNAPSQEAARPEADNPSQAESGRQGRKRLGRPSEGQDEAKPASDGPAQAATERGPDGRKPSPKQPMGKRGKPAAEEAPATARDESPKAGPDLGDQLKEQVKGEPGKAESAATERGKPTADVKSSEPQSSDVKASNAKSDETKPDAVKIEGSGDENPVARRDPVPPATSAPTAIAVTPPAVASGSSDAAASARQMPAVAPEAPAVTASAPPPPVSAGPPAPPISR